MLSLSLSLSNCATVLLSPQRSGRHSSHHELRYHPICSAAAGLRDCCHGGVHPGRVRPLLIFSVPVFTPCLHIFILPCLHSLCSHLYTSMFPFLVFTFVYFHVSIPCVHMSICACVCMFLVIMSHSYTPYLHVTRLHVSIPPFSHVQIHEGGGGVLPDVVHNSSQVCLPHVKLM